ncbi:hypothetical protein SO802_008292 [Lithocarpus litseifolius]|uniref:Pectinesterase inhibitor domain-containing protein n=1 Tax=Lithocarpus litseifolius TaxID=425828 RepID=A0AAW2DC49_9ROSI
MAPSFSLSFLLSFMLTILLICPTHAHNNVQVSEKVLYDICHNHADYSFCVKALKSDPSASLPDLVGLTNVSINLADVATNKTLELIASLKSKTSDPLLASQYESCRVFYGHIVHIIEDAKKAWKAGDYETVFVKAGGILTYNVDCSDALTFKEASSLREANKEVYNCFTTLLRVSKSLTKDG